MNIEKIKARAEAATAETNVFYRINSLTPEDLEHSLNEDGYNTCLLKLMAHALFDIPALLDALEAKERELAEYRTAEEQGLLIRLPCKVGADIYWINDEEKCVSVHKNGIRGIVVRNGDLQLRILTDISMLLARNTAISRAKKRNEPWRADNGTD